MKRRLGNPYWRYLVTVRGKPGVLCQRCLDETLVKHGIRNVEIGKYTQAACDFCWTRK